MRQIMHDWSDADCNAILAQLVRAMDQDSRLLIDDFVMPSMGAGFRPIHMDICMSMYLRSEERSERKWEHLLRSAGLEMCRVWTADGGFESIIEATVGRDCDEARGGMA